MPDWLKPTLLLVALLSPTAWAQSESPWIEISFQEHDMHAVLWEPMAHAGDAQAQFNVGVGHTQGGRDYKLDHQRALHWLTLSAEQGYPPAENNLGVYYALGRGIPRDHSKARYWFKRASAHRRIGVGYENLERIDRIIAGVEADWQPAIPDNWKAGDSKPVTPKIIRAARPPAPPVRMKPRDKPVIGKSVVKKVPAASIPVTRELNPCAFAPEHFTLQLIGAYSREKIVHYVHSGKWEQTIGYIRTRRENKDWFVVVHGDYPDREAATAAKQQFTSKKLNPWLRTFGSLSQGCPNHSSR